MRILITGGTGLIGRRLCQALLQADHDITVLSRQPDTVKDKCGAAVRAFGSLDEWKSEETFDAIINLAGEPIVDARWTEERKELLWRSRIRLTEDLVKRIDASHQKPSVMLSGSAVGFYGDGGDNTFDESSPTSTDFGATLCASWEETAQKATAMGVRVCLLRTGLVLDRSGGILGKMLLPFKLGLGARLGDGHQWMSWVHIDDYVAMVLVLLHHTHASGPFNMTAPEPVTNRVFTEKLARALHRPAIFVAPAFVMRLALAERAYLLLGGQKVIPTQITGLGYRFLHAKLEDALQDLLG
ncbi:TIGR01777 family oxidoreductase [Glaciimonas sp. CA11.2]|uniref:TIGR01777 family oxidoreductase n=1 Tax=unclassified Glaciimonas TaxID=2644401 RepID=UPI002AB391F7|nr:MULTISPECIES: TIGR01777 family oxidoreductase [unclassified Glaciimonas]MDY7545928.1 TIGR01777 family oxidoreductase [Glaciimonas sp. CA11.2]MEB0012228.1 TIGR01777 family oxidoreductase [Glaciimonas sp. Cout2]MEB0082411.1 TIGR01777 family oxidoreductase [Glaciimonas sp. Gout2]MEB0161413.1 TIGR01777 family oxidoreductase [Glaciimonas sp. CA11.2]